MCCRIRALLGLKGGTGRAVDRIALGFALCHHLAHLLLLAAKFIIKGQQPGAAVVYGAGLPGDVAHHAMHHQQAGHGAVSGQGHGQQCVGGVERQALGQRQQGGEAGNLGGKLLAQGRLLGVQVANAVIEIGGLLLGVLQPGRGVYRGGGQAGCFFGIRAGLFAGLLLFLAAGLEVVGLLLLARQQVFMRGACGLKLFADALLAGRGGMGRYVRGMARAGMGRAAPRMGRYGPGRCVCCA
ncbi:hypothetical protein AA0616_2640 [Komagataeibacter nataicola NRIC 0616]|nr:hypothetical protein AA0616_2640 [Komagataeibacter nataicola NRIC 0616]